MYVLCVTAYVKPEKIEDFLAITREYALQTRQETGNVRYDVLQSDEDLTCFVMYEAYRSKEDFLFHRETVHALRWKETIEPWMARPRHRIRCHSILFE
jgi:autoinducer 2-degrading protein